MFDNLCSLSCSILVMIRRSFARPLRCIAALDPEHEILRIFMQTWQTEPGIEWKLPAAHHLCKDNY